MPSADILSLKKINEVYLKAEAEPHIMRELSDYFTFDVPNAKFMPQYRAGIWDGKLRLLSYKDRTIYTGLVSHIKEFCNAREYVLDYEIEADDNFSLYEASQFIDSLGLPSGLKTREYQLDAFVAAIRKRRMLILSPTGSGKSLIIYLLSRYYLQHQDKKILIIVPTTSLVAQMTKDFTDYGIGNASGIHQIMAGKSKQTESRIVISTWQSLFRMPKEYFDQFGTITIDECHLVKAKSLTGILTKAPNIRYRFGTTGTLDGTLTNKLVIEGLLGEVRKITETKKLIDENILSDFMVKAIVLKHEKGIKANTKYQEEIDYLISCEERNNFIKNLVIGLEGNTLVLFNYVEKHGVPLFEMIKKECHADRKVFFVYGGTELEQRENVRKIVEEEDDAIIVASHGVFSQGVNIKQLNNIVFTHPGKSRIRTLQSIGRALRKTKNNDMAILYDIVDDLSAGKKYKNFAIKHFQERFSIYKKEKFKVKNYIIDLKIKKR